LAGRAGGGGEAATSLSLCHFLKKTPVQSFNT